MPFESEAQRRAMYAAAEGKSTLGIPEAVGKAFVSHADDNGRLKKEYLPDITELDVMRAIRDEQLPSPQQYGDVWLYAIRVTGTGYAERASGEIGYKNPNDYLTDEFLTRCQGLPVLFQHPKKLMLDSESFRDQVIGTSVLPYVHNDEVWTIARIYDINAAKLMQDSQLSTSPAVSVSNQAAKVGNILIEGNPVYIDHIAICQQGVWDKKGNPTGVRSDSITHEDSIMDETENSGGEGLRETLSKLLEEHTARLDAQFDEVHNRIDALSAKPEAASEASPEALDPEEKEEVKEEIEEVKHVVDDDDSTTCADDDDMSDDGARADSLKIDALEREVRRLKQATKPLTYVDRDAIAGAISRADSVMMALGDTNPVTHVPGESVFAFRKRIAAKLAGYSERFKGVEIAKIADEKLFKPIEDAIYADSMAYAAAPPIQPGTVHMVEKRGAYGTVMYEPTKNSDPRGWMDMFSNGAVYTGTITKS